MKYILLMSAPKAGVDAYHAWSQKDIEEHRAVHAGVQQRTQGFRGFPGY
jgi:hypothetical protein